MSDTFNLEGAGEHSPAESSKPEGPNGPKIPGLQLISKKDETSSAVVWCALQLSLDREVTVWMMKDELAHKAAHVEHFEAVSRAVSRIRHPNLVRVIDVARTPEGTPYVVFEDVEGTMLASLLRIERKFDPMRALRIGIEIASALDFAWKQCGFVHRNIKPETIILGANDAVKLTNFGSATLVKPGQNPLANDEGLVVGTPNYASPEQIDCLRTIDYHSDMYSTGALLYRMITGVTPFGDEENPMAIFDLQRVGTLKNPRDIDANVKPGVVHIVQKMMAKAPEDRYTWWQDAIEDMHRVLEGRPPYLTSGNYVPPPSTIASALTEEVSPSRVSFKLPKKATKLPSGGAPFSSTTTPPASKRVSGPSAFVKLVVVFLLVGFSFFLISVRLGNLEHLGSTETASDTPTSSDDSVVPFEGEDAQLSEFSEDNASISDDGESFDSQDDENGLAPSVSVRASQTESTGHSWSEAAEKNDGMGAVKPELSQGELVETLYRNVRDYSLGEARERARSLFQKSKQVAGLDEEQSKLIWRAFSEASSYEDLVGFFLANSPGKRTLIVGGEELEVTPRLYSNGELIGTLHFKDGASEDKHRIQLSDMSAAEMYDCLQASVVDTHRSALFARAFLTMKMKDRGAFSIFISKYELNELEPFLDYIGK